MVDMHDAPLRSELALFQELRGELVLIHVDTGQYYVLNDVGRRVWELCDGSTTVADMATALCVEFEAESAVIQADIIELFDGLERERLIVRPG